MRIRALGTLVTAAAMVVAGPAVAASAVADVAGAPSGVAGSPVVAGRVIGAGARGAVPGRYIVTMKSGRGGASALAAVHAAGVASAAHRVAALGTALGPVADSPGGGAGGEAFVASLTAAEARRVAADPDVRVVEQDRLVHVAATQRGPVWGLDRIDQRAGTASKTFTPMADGDSVHAYVIDTGIRITHSEFGGRASYGYDFIAQRTVAADCNGHGTHVAGTIGGARYGVAKKARLVAVRVLDCQGSGLLSDVIRGVDWVTRNAVRPAVANMSMGGAYSPALEAAVQRSIAAGITYVVAAGNEDVNAAALSPAGLPAAITVGATDRADRRASFSNYGSVLDLFAPGVGITSAVAASNTATGVYSGTSMASPHVAGAAALFLDAYPVSSPAKVRDFLVGQATTGRVADRAGSPNRLLFVPAPATAPVIATSGLTVQPGVAFSARLALRSARRGWWSLASGTLPAGLTLTSAGVISGTPTRPGTGTVTVRFADYVPTTVSRTLAITVRNTPPLIDTAALPSAQTGSAYRTQLSVVDGRAGSWSLAGGVLPAGLTLSAAGVLSGVPTGETATMTIRFTDIWGAAATRDFTLVVDAAA